MKTMLDYIGEEQSVLTKIIEEFTAQHLDFHDVNYCLILATGSSFNACQSAKFYLEETAHIMVDIQEPSNFFHYGKVDPRVELVIAVSQSGKSASTIYAIKKITETASVRTLAMTSNKNSPITKVVDEVIDLNMGVETVGFVTKGYSATVLNVMLLAIEIGYQNTSITKDTCLLEENLLKQAVSTIDSIIEKTESYWNKNKEALYHGKRFITIGYGPNVGTAKEFETKFTETVRVPSQGFELEAYMHGPYLEANETHSMFFIESDTSLMKRSRMLKKYMRKYVANCYSIVLGHSQDSTALNLEVSVPEKISPLLLVVPFQYLSYQIATAKGIDLSKRIFEDFDDVLKSKI